MPKSISTPRTAYHRAYYKANREKLLAYQHAYYHDAQETMREKIAAQKRAYAERNRGRIQAKQRARRARAKLLTRSYDLIEAAKRRASADPMRHWKSPPPCS